MVNHLLRLPVISLDGNVAFKGVGPLRFPLNFHLRSGEMRNPFFGVQEFVTIDEIPGPSFGIVQGLFCYTLWTICLFVSKTLK